MSYAPVALFVYKRLDHVKKTIESLKRAEMSDMTELFIFSDGSKNIEDAEQVNDVREYIQAIDGFLKVIITKRDSNYGLSRSIVEGVSEVLSKYGKIVVLEDDLVVSKYFLKFMNSALDLYKDNDEVISIHGYVYPADGEYPETFFLRGADCWGWATWDRGWRHYNPDGKYLLQQLYNRKLHKVFDFDCTYPYMRMLRNQVKGKNDSWAVRWYASAFLANKLTLYPGISLVKNIGNDESGSHSKKTNIYDVELISKDINVEKLNFTQSVAARNLFKKYFKRNIWLRLKSYFTLKLWMAND